MRKYLYYFFILFLILCLAGCNSSILCNHNTIEATCSQPEFCTKCGKNFSEAKGHNYHGTTCNICGEKRNNYLSREEVFSQKPENLYFTRDYSGEVRLQWKQKYDGGKDINYITIYCVLHDRVGNNIDAFPYQSNTLVGPFNAGEYIDVSGICNFTNTSNCGEILIQSVKLEYADGTEDYVEYGWQNNVIVI